MDKVVAYPLQFSHSSIRKNVVTMKLHMLGLPHTVTTSEYSHCAFTGKIQRFSPMMRSGGYEVLHYGVGGADRGANLDIEIMTREEQEGYIGKFDPKSPDFIGKHANWSTPLYREFNRRLNIALDKNVEKGDAICLPFGPGHREALNEKLSRAYWIESGIGYPNPYLAFRVYESYSQLHRIGGVEIEKKGNSFGSNYHWVIPNYYDLSEWGTSFSKGEYVLYMGRIDDIKGLPTVVEMAKATPDLKFVLAGQGDPSRYLQSPNIEYVGPVHGTQRSKLFEGAMATLCPSRYYEPFCGVAVESMLCGTPVLSVSYGAFTETIEQGKTGYRCKTLGDWLEALHRVRDWGESERKYIAEYARGKYDMMVLAHEYDKTFQQLADLGGKGWFSDKSYI